MNREDSTLERLLDLDGEIMDVGGGFWISIKAERVPATPHRPHGINYSLCLFDGADERIICFDNAHTIVVGSGPGKMRSKVTDHVHAGKRIRPYVYNDAETLVVDFWSAVYDFLKKKGV